MASYWLAKSLTYVNKPLTPQEFHPYFMPPLRRLIGLLYAVYRSFKVLKEHRGVEHNAETNRMLMLW